MEQLYTIADMDSAFAAAIKCRNEVFFGTHAPVVVSTIVQIQRLAFPDLMIEIKCLVKI
jgi:2-iminobutanoate/2-iminopropanoate deaminase